MITVYLLKWNLLIHLTVKAVWATCLQFYWFQCSLISYTVFFSSNYGSATSADFQPKQFFRQSTKIWYVQAKDTSFRPCKINLLVLRTLYLKEDEIGIYCYLLSSHETRKKVSFTDATCTLSVIKAHGSLVMHILLKSLCLSTIDKTEGLKLNSFMFRLA